MKNLFYILICLLAFSCSKSEIETWSAQPRVWFTEENDTTVFSFYSQPAETMEYVVELPISMAGLVAETDREVSVEDLGGSSFNPGSEYEVVSAVIPAGEVTGTVSVRVRKTENLNTANDTLTFRLVSSDVFALGNTEEYWQSVLVISNSLSKPTWWDEDAEMYLGYYSDLKMEIIYTVLGSDEMFSSGNNSWYSDEMTIAIYRLNRYCIDNNVKYHPDDESVVQFDFWTE